MKKLSFVVAVGCSCGLAVASDRDWPGLRGPRHDGAAPGKLEAIEGAGFAVAWRATLGAGYSSVAVAGGRAEHPLAGERRCGDRPVVRAVFAAQGGRDRAAPQLAASARVEGQGDVVRAVGEE